MEFLVTEALKTIPRESEFYQCIADVIGWYHMYPDDWKKTWFETERKWSSDVGCPDGVFEAFNIDAKINAAYIVIGLLYGEGDFGKTVDISTRCGQDSDCNPASAGGILGTVLGYDRIPGYWKQGLDRVEDLDFRYTTISLNDVYDMSYRHALQMIERNGGEVLEDEVIITLEEPVPVRFEKGFEGHFPVSRIDVPWEKNRLQYGGQTEAAFSFDGKGFVVKGGAMKETDIPGDTTLVVEAYVDGELYETAELPTGHRTRRHDVTWKYNLSDGPHELKLHLIDPPEGYYVQMDRILVYGPEPADHTY